MSTTNTEKVPTTIDEVLAQWAKQLNMQDPILEPRCIHEPREYVGFTERYHFCEKCDAKLIDGIWRETQGKH